MLKTLLAVVVLLSVVGAAMATPLDDTRMRVAILTEIYVQAYDLVELLHKSTKTDGTPRISEEDYITGMKLCEMALREYYHFVLPWGGYIGFDTEPLKLKVGAFAIYVIQKASESLERL
jgi:hypothetical protein